MPAAPLSATSESAVSESAVTATATTVATDGAGADGPGEAAAPATCPACPHLLQDHDRIGTRYCSATIKSSSTRGCVCAR